MPAKRACPHESDARVRDCHICLRAIWDKHAAKRDPQKERLRSRQKTWRSRGMAVTISDYNRLHDLQGGMCALCGGPPTGAKVKMLVWDHNHTTGDARGLLCHKCNLLLGRADDSIERLHQAILYLEKHNLRRSLA